MKSYRYKVTMEMVAGQRGEGVAPEDGRAITFEVPNHDDVLAIAERMQARLPYEADDAKALAVGLKLLSEVALMHRADPLFAEIRPALKEFAGKLKALPTKDAAEG